MKKVVCAILACVCLPVFALDWELPVMTLRYEVAQGSREDPDEELMMPSSLRNTVSLRIKEAADPAVFELTLRCSLKDYYLAAGDFSYLELEHEQTWRTNDWLKVGFTLGGKKVAFPEFDENGLPKSYWSLKAGTNAVASIVPGTNLEGGFAARCDLAENDGRTFQVYVASAALTTRLDSWMLSARYRGEFRLPLGESSATARLSYNTCSLTMQWDPN